MKVRNGFVSNSSSSSFVIAFKSIEKPKSIEEMYEEVFGIIDDKYLEKQLKFDIWGDNEENPKIYNAFNICKIILDEIKEIDSIDDFLGQFYFSIEDYPRCINLFKGHIDKFDYYCYEKLEKERHDFLAENYGIVNKETELREKFEKKFGIGMYELNTKDSKQMAFQKKIWLEGSKFIDKENYITNIYNKRFYNLLIKKYKKIYRVEFSDNDPEPNSFLEHQFMPKSKITKVICSKH